MIFRQLFDSTSGTYTYLIASRHGGEALIIDPVLERVDRYLQLVRSSTSSWSRLWIRICTRRCSPGSAPARPHPLYHRNGRAHPRRCRLHAGFRGRPRRDRGTVTSTCSTAGHTDNSYSFLWADESSPAIRY